MLSNFKELQQNAFNFFVLFFNHFTHDMSCGIVGRQELIANHSQLKNSKTQKYHEVFIHINCKIVQKQESSDWCHYVRKFSLHARELQQGSSKNATIKRRKKNSTLGQEPVSTFYNLLHKDSTQYQVAHSELRSFTISCKFGCWLFTPKVIQNQPFPH